MTAMIITSILLVVLYVGATIWVKKEIPESISAMVYDLPKGGWRWLWTAWLIIVDVLTFAPAIEILDEKGMGFMGFIPMVMIAFVAIWPLCDTSHQKWHYLLSIVAGLWSQVFDVAMICPWWLFLWILWPLAAWYITKSNEKGEKTILNGCGVFLAEAICYTGLIAAILCR